MPAALRDWPWTAMKLVTFTAPVSGDADWAVLRGEWGEGTFGP